MRPKNILVLALLLILACAGCGWTDWDYDLPNQCQVWYINGDDIVIVDRSAEFHSTVVDNYVSAFCYNDRYVGVRRIIPENSLQCTEEERQTKEPVYYIIDTEEKTVYGPFNEAGYEEGCGRMGITDLCEWIGTSPMPDGAYYIGEDPH